MKLMFRISGAILALMILGALIYANLQKVRIGQVGVLTKEWGGGLVEEDHGPGYWLDLGPLHTWNLFDATVQTFERSGNRAFVVKSVDGADVTLDVSVKFRIRPGEAWKILKRFGPGNAYQDKVANESIDAMRAVFGELITEDFYDPTKREETAERTRVKLAKRLETLNVELVAILVRDVSFTETYEDRIRQKELAKQEADVNIAKKKAAEAAGLTNKIIAETVAKVIVIEEERNKTIRNLTAENQKSIAQIEAEAAQFVVERRADADLYKAEKIAGADLLIRNAEAAGQALRRHAMTLPGTRNLVALEAAENLNFDKVVISTLANNVLDLEALARRLGAMGAAAGKRPASPSRD